MTVTMNKHILTAVQSEGTDDDCVPCWDVGTSMKPCTLLCNVHRSVSGDAVVFGAATKSPGTVSGAP